MKYDVIVVGGGPAGLAAAVEASKNGAEKVLVVERDQELGGILNQCIHNGFGLHYFKEELTGPEYAERFIKELKTISKVEGYVIKTAFYMNSPKETKAYPDHLEDIDLSLEDLLATTISVQFKVLKKADKSPVVNFSQEVGPFNANTNSQKTRNLISKNLESMINKTIIKDKK